MTTPEALHREIADLTSDLIEVGLCVDQNYPSIRPSVGGVVDIDLGPSKDLSATFKNTPYSDAYAVLREDRTYNMKMVDGGLLQLMYRFRAGDLVRHRLAFFPSPDLLEFQNNAEVYELDEMYADVVERSVVTTPVRFDFDPGAFVEFKHPMSHFTLGQYQNCRIPVGGPLTPFLFVNFVLRAFYNTSYQSFSASIRERRYSFAGTITAGEARYIHLKSEMAV